jgi:hypothetical protein
VNVGAYWQLSGEARTRQIDEARPIGVHQPDPALAGIVHGLDIEHDLGPVGRPVRVLSRASNEVRDTGQAGPVGSDGVDLRAVPTINGKGDQPIPPVIGRARRLDREQHQARPKGNGSREAPHGVPLRGHRLKCRTVVAPSKRVKVIAFADAKIRRRHTRIQHNERNILERAVQRASPSRLPTPTVSWRRDGDPWCCRLPRRFLSCGDGRRYPRSRPPVAGVGAELDSSTSGGLIIRWPSSRVQFGRQFALVFPIVSLGSTRASVASMAMEDLASDAGAGRGMR